jgi:4'-phosphopantetheinyl transferase
MTHSLEPIRVRHFASRFPQEVLLWAVDLDQYAAEVELDGLSASEVEVAYRKVFARDRNRLLASRHALRRVLGSLVGRSPAALRIEADTWGRPAVLGADNVDFNVSHSDRCCLIAACSGLSIGVDIEVVRPIADAGEIAREHFSDDERAELKRVPVGDVRAFLCCWTRKEACLKALGVGVSGGLAAVNAGCAPSPRGVSVPVGLHRSDVFVASIESPFEAVAAIALTDRANATLARRFLAPS